MLKGFRYNYIILLDLIFFNILKFKKCLKVVDRAFQKKVTAKMLSKFDVSVAYVTELFIIIYEYIDFSFYFLLVVLYGVISIGIAFTAKYMGSHVLQVRQYCSSFLEVIHFFKEILKDFFIS